MQLEQVYRRKMTVTSDENDEYFFFYVIFISFWLGFQIFVKSLKPFISAYWPLINKRALICDHSQLLTLFTFEKYLFTFTNFDRDRFSEI
jgi:hypothetical protein